MLLRVVLCTIILQLLVFLAKNWPQENTRNTRKGNCISAFFALHSVRIQDFLPRPTTKEWGEDRGENSQN